MLVCLRNKTNLYLNTPLGRARVKCDNQKTVMIITKAKDRQLVTLTREMTLWLTRYGDEDGLTV